MIFSQDSGVPLVELRPEVLEGSATVFPRLWWYLVVPRLGVDLGGKVRKRVDHKALPPNHSMLMQEERHQVHTLDALSTARAPSAYLSAALAVVDFLK